MPGKTVVEQLVIEILGDSRKYLKEIRDVQKANRKAEDSAKSMSKVLRTSFLVMGGAVTAFGVLATKQFLKFETGVTNVAKTTNLAGKELKEFEKEILSMSERIPVTTDRLLEIATAAGQLGIKGTKDLSKFTETIAKLGATTDLEGEQAALAIARILNLTNESIQSVDKLGATLVDLGNNFAASESEILEVAKDVAKAVVQFDLASDEILGISAAMASLGIASEAGGTVIGKAFQAINQAIRTQTGPAFEKLIELTGMTGDALTETFQTDARIVFESFIKGLGKAGDEGRDLTKEMAAMNLSGIRVNKILPTLASRSDLFGDAMERAAGKTKNAAALTEESERAFGTGASRLAIAQNKLSKSTIAFGESFAQAAVPIIEFLALLLTVDDEAAKSFGGKGLTAQNKLIKTLQQSRKEALNYTDSWNKANKAVGEGTEEAAKKANMSLKKAAAVRKNINSKLAKEEEKKQQKLVDQQLKSDNEMFEEIDQFSDDVVAEYEERHNMIIEGARKFNEEFSTLSSEMMASLSDEQKTAFAMELEEVTAQKKTIAEIEADSLIERQKDKIKEHNKFLKDEAKFGKKMAHLKKVQGKAEYGNVKIAADQLSSLIDSENQELKEIGKAATIVQMTMSTVEGAMKAFNSLSWIPYVGWALGGIAAAAVSAHGLEQINQVRAMKEGGVFGTEGKKSIVPGIGTGDKVNAILEPGELVVPKDITNQLMKEYGIRKFANGGTMSKRGALGEEQKTGLHNTFARIFEVPAIFKALIAGEDGESNVGGFGSENFNGMVPAMMGALRESAYIQQEKLLSANDQVPFGKLLAKAQVLMNKPIDELHDILSDNSVTDWISEQLGTEVGAIVSGGGPLVDGLNNEINKVINDIGSHVRRAFGFENGGMVGAVAPGEMRLSRKALSAIAGGVGMPSNSGQISRPSIARSSSAGSGGVQKVIMGVEINIADDAVDFITAQQREKNLLNT